MNERELLSITRPDKKLLTLYVVRAILSGPGVVFLLPLLLFRYHTMAYKFDATGLSMSWGFFFRKQTTLSYSRIQDIHLESGIIQRWLGLADLQIQTASGSAEAEMVVEGILHYEDLRNYLYSKMRGYKDLNAPSEAPKPSGATPQPAESEDVSEEALLKALTAELAGARAAAEKLAAGRQADV